MILFDSIGLSVGFMLIGMFFTGSWPNLFKYREGQVRKEHLFIIYSFSSFFVALLAAFTLGSFGSYEPNFMDNLRTGSVLRVLAAVAGGICISLCYLFKVFALELCGLAVAAPTSSGIAIIGGTLLNYAIAPVSKFYLLIVGVALVVIALIFESLCILQKQKSQILGTDVELTKEEELQENHTTVSSAEESCNVDETSAKVKSARKLKLGVTLAIVSGFFGCLWAPLSTYSMQYKGLDGTLTAYTSFFYVMIGCMIAGFLTNIYFLHRPVSDHPKDHLRAIFRLGWKVYAIGIAAGAIMALGNLFSFVAGQSSGDYVVSFAIARANPLVAAIYGVVLWKDFNNTDMLTKILFGLTILFYIGGIVSIAFCA